jgi:release factor glutamine methyltransferase
MTITGASRLHLLNNPLEEISNEQSSRIINICEELKTGKPYQYVLGETSFYNCTIKVDPSVLIPRPETEELADLIIQENKGFKGKIIDFGTGSGCIAIALAVNLPAADVIATDISEKALSLAGYNARLNNASVRFIRDDIFNPNPELTEPGAGIIVSNPPYVRYSEQKLMKNNVTGFEPHLALFVDDSNPLVYYKALLGIADKILSKEGKIYFEINEALGNEMSALLDSYGYSDIGIIKDINGRDRIIKGIHNVR